MTRTMTSCNENMAHARSMYSSAHTAEAAFCCASAMNNAVVMIMDTTLLVSIFAVLGIMIRLWAVVIISVIISIIVLVIKSTYPTFLKGPLPSA